MVLGRFFYFAVRLAWHYFGTGFRNSIDMKGVLLILSIMIFSCVRAEQIKVAAIDDFDISRYLGTWYEIARMDHPFERGLVSVTANYTLRADGKIQVLNQGFSVAKDEWRSSKAVAKTTHVPNKLRVFFFPLISASYNVAYVDEDYTLAVVSGGSSRYLWFLSRTSHISLEEQDRLVAVARSLGYHTNELIYVSQDLTPPLD